MQKMSLNAMVKGWFVGDFNPTALQTRAAEVGVKRYELGDHEVRHFHMVATEVTVIVEGRVRMNGQEFVAGDILVIEPGEATDFLAIEKSVTVVVKVPGAKHDKFAET